MTLIRKFVRVWGKRLHHRLLSEEVPKAKPLYHIQSYYLFLINYKLPVPHFRELDYCLYTRGLRAQATGAVRTGY